MNIKNVNTTLAGKVLRLLKNEFHLTNKNIADKYGFHINTIERWVNGKAVANFDDVVAIIECYNADLFKYLEMIKNDNK